MNLRRALESLLLFGILALTVEILVRRLAFQQIPSQLHFAWVYALVAFNLGVVAWRAKRLLQGVKSR